VPTDMGELANRVEAVRGGVNGLAGLDASGKVPLAQLPAAAYATTLPGSPLDGQEAILVDSVTNPIYQWRFRYNAGSTSAYKWEFVGGTPFHGEMATADNSHPTPGTWLGLTPVLPLPRAGDYLFTYSVAVFPTTAVQLRATIDLNNVGRDDWLSGVVGSATAMFSFGRANLFANGLASGTSVNITSWANVASQPFSRRHLSIIPVRVS
jgi:hypothetical protein